MARRGLQGAGPDEDQLPGRVAVGVLTRAFPPGLVDDVVAAAKVGEHRIRILPARLVVYYTLAMILFFQSSYSEVWVKLIGGLDWAKAYRDRVAAGVSPSPAAISKARARLGSQVMADLLDRVAGPLAGQRDGWAYVAGLRLVAMDGLTIDVAATARNAAEFGQPWDRSDPRTFPQVRVVALAECGSRALMGARCAGIVTAGHALAAQLMGLLGPGMLMVADDSFLSRETLRDALATGAHALFRATADMDLPVLSVLADGTYISRIADAGISREPHLDGTRGGGVLGTIVRVIEYSVSTEGGKNHSQVFRLVTDLIDPAQLRAMDAADAYAQRWEIETAFGELRIGTRGRPAGVLRSKSPDMIRQELYAALCVYQAVRTLIGAGAKEVGLEPDRISFTCEMPPARGAAALPSSDLDDHVGSPNPAP